MKIKKALIRLLSGDILRLMFYLFKVVYRILKNHGGLIYGLMIFEVKKMVVLMVIEKIKLFVELLLVILLQKFLFFFPQFFILFIQHQILQSVYLYYHNFLIALANLTLV